MGLPPGYRDLEGSKNTNTTSIKNKQMTTSSLQNTNTTSIKNKQMTTSSLQPFVTSCSTTTTTKEKKKKKR